MKPFVFLLFLLTLLNLSCSNKEVPLYPPGEPGVVLHSILSPKEPIIVSLNYTRPLESLSQPPGSDIIRSAEMYLYADGLLIDTLRYRDLHYHSKFEGSLQTTYKVVGSIPGQKGLVKAETEIPDPADIQILKLDSIYREGETYTRITLKVKDPINRVYYDLRVERFIIKDTSSAVRTEEPILASSPRFNFLMEDLFVFSGAEIRSTNDIVELYIPHFSQKKIKDSLVVSCISINEDFHNFLLSNSNQNDNELLAGYDRTFTNIENGLGIFTGTSITKTNRVW